MHDVNYRSCNPFFCYCFYEAWLVNDLPARCVYDVSGRLHAGESIPPDHVFSFRRAFCVDAYIVSVCKAGMKICFDDSDLFHF